MTQSGDAVEATPRSWSWRPGPVPGCARTPRRCCTRWRAAACCRTRCTRWPRWRRSTSSWCSATTASASPPRSPSWPMTLGRTDRRRRAGAAARHRPRRRLRPGRTAGGLHRHRRGHLRRCPAAGRRHAGRPDRHPQRRIGRGDRADHHAARSDRLRPHPAHPGPRGHGIVEEADATPSQRAIREVNAGVYAFDIAALRSALSRLRSHNAQQELYLTDVISIVRQDGQVVHAKHVDDSTLVAGVNDRVQLAELGAELNRRIVAAHQRAGVTIVDPATTWIDVDVTIGRDTVVHPGHAAAGRHPHRRALPDRPRHHADRRHRRRRRHGGPHPRRPVGDR